MDYFSVYRKAKNEDIPNYSVKLGADSLISVNKTENCDFFDDEYIAAGLIGTVYAPNFSEHESIAKHIAEHYMQSGISFLSDIEGSFVLFVIDKKAKKTICARDHFGSAPLFYAFNHGEFFVSTSLSKVANSGIIKKEISADGLTDYFTLNHIPAPKTIFNNIYALRAGEYFEYSSDSGMCDTGIYWDVNPSDKNMIKDHEKCVSNLREALISSVEDRINYSSNGVFLSGGIDSTVITGIASKLLGKKIDTFTMGFREAAFDESGRAAIAAKAFGTQHHLYTLDYSDVLGELEKIIDGFEQPFADASAIPTWIINKFAASSKIDNVLTGDGSDQIFSGSNKYLITYYVGKYKSIPKIARIPFEKVFSLVPDTSSTTRKVRKVISCTNMSTLEMRRRMLQLGLPETEISNLILRLPEKINGTVDEYYSINSEIADELTNTLYVDLKVVADSCMMTKMGSMSRMAGVRTHIPMLSKSVLDCAFSIPAEYKQRKSSGKIILKEAFSDIIPKELLTASKKGFDPPMAEWFRGELESDLLRVLNKSSIENSGLLKYDYIRQLIDEHKSCKADRSSVLWAIYVFQKWYNKEFNL